MSDSGDNPSLKPADAVAKTQPHIKAAAVNATRNN